MDAIQVKKMMILDLIKYIPEIEICRLTTEYHIVDIFIKFVVVRRIFTNVSPQDDLTGLLVHVQGLHHHHNVFDVIRKLFDGKLIIVYQFIGCAGNNVKFESIHVNV